MENFEPKFNSNIEKPKETYWFEIMQRLSKERGEIIDPLSIRADIFVSTLGIPSGEISAIEIDKEGHRVNQEKDKIIAEYLTNKPGVWVDKERLIVSSDFRDIYPNGLPSPLKQVFDKRTLAIFENEYEHQRAVRKKFGRKRDVLENERQINYFRLPGGGRSFFARIYS